MRQHNDDWAFGPLMNAVIPNMYTGVSVATFLENITSADGSWRVHSACDTTVLFVRVSANFGSKQSALLLTKKRNKEKTDKKQTMKLGKTEKRVQITFMWCCYGGVASLTTDWRHTGDTGSVGSSRVQKSTCNCRFWKSLKAARCIFFSSRFGFMHHWAAFIRLVRLCPDIRTQPCVFPKQTGPPLHRVLCPDWIKWAGIPENVFHFNCMSRWRRDTCYWHNTL